MENDTSLLVNRLAELCNERALKVTTVESCTGGGIAYALTSVAGSSDWFEQGVITYANQAKCQLADVPDKLIQQFGAVSQQTVEAMALGSVKQANADIAIAVSGVAGPGGGSIEKPVGTVWFAWVVCGELFSERILFSGTRAEVREQAIKHSLSFLINHLEKRS